MLYISVISHGHFDLIKELHCIDKLSVCNDIKVIVVDNLVEKNFDAWCKKNGVYYLANKNKLGFGENNNNAFNYLVKNFDFSLDDFFLVLNPDVFIDMINIKRLIDICSSNKYNLSTINLYSDFNLKEFDNSIRNYPRLIDWFSSFLFGVNKAKINKLDINEHARVDWGAGSFLMFTVGFYSKLKGFDEKYYMYCEDIDICNRADILYGEKLVYIPEIKAVHLARHKNKKILSKHFFWHLKSIIRYLLVRRTYRHE